MRALSLTSTILALSVTLGVFVGPSTAAPLSAPSVHIATTDVIPAASELRIERRGDYRYFNGRRGYRNYRDGYRRYDGYWFPGEAFIGLSILNGIVQQQYRPPYNGNSHINWCFNRYRSYDVSSDSYQPYSGGRRRCNSPYN